jgi:L-xylulokinase
MRTDIFIGIDMGSTGLKAVAFEGGSGSPLAASGGALPFFRLPGGGCELSGQAIRSALVHALRNVAAQLGPRTAEVRAIGCTGHGAGLYALDARHQLIGGCAVASTDQRAGARARALAASHGPALFEEVGCQPWSGQPTLIAAELFGADAVQRGDIHRLLFAKDYLTWLLTGEFATDASDASTAGLLSLASGTWSRLAFDAAGLPDLAAGTLPPIVPTGTVIGTLTSTQARDCGLPAGLPVTVGAIDLLASLNAVGAEHRGQAVAVLGTWCVNAVIGPVAEPKPPVGAIVNFGEPGRRLYLENSPSSMANVAWLARALQFPSAAAVVDCAMSVPLGADGLRFLPFINGGGSPPGASAGFIGLKGHHDRSHMARAVVDAVAALHARHLLRLASFGLGVPGLVAALGGGARDVRLVRLLASFLGHPVERCGDDETGARGAAQYAARSQGPADDAVLPAPCDVVLPTAHDAQAHADFYAGFNDLVESLSPAFAVQAKETA